MKKIVRCGISVLAFLILSCAAWASDNSACASEDVSTLFCSAADDESLYDKYKFDSYKMLRPGTNGWIFRSESDFKKDFSLTREGLDSIEELNNALKRRGVELVVLMTPTRGLVHYDYISEEDRRKYGFEDRDKLWKNYWKAIDSVRDRGVQVVGIEHRQSDSPFFYKRDHHWNSDGAHEAARALADYIKKMPVYDTIEKVEFETTPVEPYEMEGVSKKVFKKLCNTTQKPESIMRLVTTPKQSIGNQDALFGETKRPEIVLLGTSNSTPEPSFANFEGFLKQELSADILNMSVSGGGLDTAMISYLNSEHFKNTPAKVAIWEIPSYYDISAHYTFFREAVPAAYGSCRDNAVAQTMDQKITEKTMLVLDKLAGKKITGSKYYLDIAFDSPVSRNFFADMRYLKNRDKYRFQRISRYPHDGQFYVGLRDDKKECLDKVVLSVPSELIGKTVSVSLCEKKKDSFYAEKSPDREEPNTASGVNNLLGKIKGALNL